MNKPTLILDSNNMYMYWDKVGISHTRLKAWSGKRVYLTLNKSHLTIGHITDNAFLMSRFTIETTEEHDSMARNGFYFIFRI